MLWINIDNKELFHISKNSGTYDTCDSSLAGSSNVSLIGVRKHGSSISLLLFNENEDERIISYMYQYIK